MWFHLLSVAAFLALGSCRDYHGHSRSSLLKPCFGPGCPCDCPQNSCPPCPIPQPYECLSECGVPECPCLYPDEDRRSEDSYFEFAADISTVIVKPTGPICSAINIGNRLMMTVNMCVAGISLEHLYVATAGAAPESLKVKQILYLDRINPSPVVLLTEKAKKKLPILALPPIPINPDDVAKITKWEVMGQGRAYVPVRWTVKSHAKCLSGEDLICAETYNTTVMGWNDIGTPLTEISDGTSIVQGMYIGADLFRKTKTVKYLPIYKYYEWLYEIVNKYA